MEIGIDPKPHKYGYSTGEQMAMLLITAVTNLSGTPSIIYLYRMGRVFEAWSAFFTMWTSFMYHAVESINNENIYLTEMQWHRLDNIGAITCFMMISIHLMDNKNPDLDLKLYLSSFTIVLLAQEKDPWNLAYTLVPIVSALIGFLAVLAFRKRKPEYNNRNFGMSMFFLFCGAICFSQGLDEYKDYLRIYHGCWHMFIGFTSFYFWQIKVPPGHEFGWLDFWRKPIYHKLIENSGVNRS